MDGLDTLCFDSVCEQPCLLVEFMFTWELQPLFRHEWDLFVDHSNNCLDNILWKHAFVFLQEALLSLYSETGCLQTTKTRQRTAESTTSCHIRLKLNLLEINMFLSQTEGMKIADVDKIPERLRDPLEDSISFDQDTNFRLHGPGHALTFIFGKIIFWIKKCLPWWILV